MSRRTLLAAGLGALAGKVLPSRAAHSSADPAPIVIGLDAEFGLINSTSAQAIEKGISVAIHEINAAGGLLGGRPLALRTTDNRSISARAVHNVRQLLADPQVVAIFGGRFSPSVLESLPIVHEHRVPLLVPWSAADQIIDNGFLPNFAFRLSLRDGDALPAMLQHAAAKGWTEIGVLVPNTAWGRSSRDAIDRYVSQHQSPRVVASEWFNWGDQSLIQKYLALYQLKPSAIVFIANDSEAAVLINELAAVPADLRLPIISHWGVTGGQFAKLVGPKLHSMTFTVVQTFSFFSSRSPKTERVLSLLHNLYGVQRPEDIDSPVGFAHGYDLTHILARAIALAGSTDGSAVREALERVRGYQGLVRYFEQPFSPSQHEALGPEDIFIARYAEDGSIRPLPAIG